MAKIRVVIDCIDYQYQSIDKLVSIGCLQLTNRFHVAVRLFSNGSQRTSKCGKNINDTRLSHRVQLFCSYHIVDVL